MKFFRNFKTGCFETNFLDASFIILKTETFDVETGTGITGCHIVNNLLTELARAVLGNIGPRSWHYGHLFARFVLPRPRANVSQYGPHARLVSD